MHRARADLLHRHDGKDGREGFDLFFIDIAVRFDGHIAAREARAAGRDHHVDLGIGAPSPKLIGDLRAFVLNDLAIRELVARLGNPPHKRIARAILGQRAGVADC